MSQPPPAPSSPGFSTSSPPYGESAQDSAVNSENIAYLNGLYISWLENPSSIDSGFSSLFSALQTSLSIQDKSATMPPLPSEHLGEKPGEAHWKEQLENTFRLYGHLAARLDPLAPLLPGPANHSKKELAELSLTQWLSRISPQGAESLTSLHRQMTRFYCGSIGAEFMHLQDAAQRNWWINHLEASPAALPLSPEHILTLLTQAEGFEFFCQKRFTGMRRFGLEGGESLVIALQALINESMRDKVRSISLGMPHRGRLNVMANILKKPHEAIFSEFEGNIFQPEGLRVSGDVKYHLGTATILTQGRHKLRIALLPNPSHLEAVDPVVLGRVRADQDRHKDIDRRQHLGILVHGDAAFAGQGVVYEALQLSRLEGYKTGGTIHLIVNNQIGFTTGIEDAHSGIWNTDVAKTVQAPILHVNGDDPEAVARCAALAHAWRRDFSSDIIIDIICYRRHGHNETDEPGFTQPSMVQAISAHRPVRLLYGEKLHQCDEIPPDRIKALWDDVQHHLHQAYESAKNYKPDGTDWLDYSPRDPTRLQDEPERLQPMTGVPLPRLREIGTAMATYPQGFILHPRLARQLEARRACVMQDGPIDWATAEALAFGSVALDGHPVRLSGQDCGRGTFSQRHAVLTEQTTQTHFIPLAHIAPRQAPVTIWNSPLSEYGVMGFEYGYSLGNPEALVLWEAQFGDFANGAQIIIDQFLAAGETKWLRSSGLVLLLPHGHEGAGPEHSSARPERFLQLCAENNLRVSMPSTPASLFHLLRRQIARRCRKPLIIFSPKSLLRHKRAVSSLHDIGPQTRFQPLLADPASDPATGKPSSHEGYRLVLCAGKIYYDLLARREEAEKSGLLASGQVVLIRLEQFYPFPHHALVQLLNHYPQAQSLTWCQEEPRNGGAWNFVREPIEQALHAAGHMIKRPRYAGRAASAAPATGTFSQHQAEQTILVEDALCLHITPDQ